MGREHAMDGFTFRLITSQIIYYSKVFSFAFRHQKLLYLGRVTNPPRAITYKVKSYFKTKKFNKNYIIIKLILKLFR